MDKKKKIIISSLIILAVILLTFGIITFKVENNKKIILNSLNTLKTSLKKDFTLNPSDKISKRTGSGMTTFYLNPNFFNDSDLTSIINNINNLRLSYNYILDNDSKKIYVNNDFLLQNDKILNFNYFQNNNTGYLFLTDIFDKYLKIANLNEFFTSNNSKYFLEALGKSLNNNITKDDIKTSSTTINNKKVKVLKLTLTPTKSTTILKDALKTLKTSSKTKEAFKDVNLSDDLTTNLKTIDYELSLSQKNIIKYSLSYKEDGNLITLEYNDLEKSLTIKNNNTPPLKSIISNDKENITIEISYDNKSIGRLIINNNSTILDLNINRDSNSKLNITFSKVKSDNLINTSFNINLTSNQEKLNLLEINNQETFENKADFSKVDTTNNININDLSDTDKTLITDKLLSILSNFTQKGTTE